MRIPVFQIPNKCHDTIRLKDPTELCGCLAIVRTPMEGLSDYDKICPTILDAGVIKCPFCNRDPLVLDGLGEYTSHTLTWLKPFKLVDRLGPFWVGEEGAGEDPGPGTKSMRRWSNSLSQ